ncbi:MAG: HAD family hydrolase, partial [Gammaproteobacteria bacterium]
LQLDGNGYVTREAFFQGLASYIERPEVDGETISAHFVEHAWMRPQPMRGAVEGLRRLRSAGLPIGVVTNGGSLNQRKKLTNTGLMQLVDDCVISEDVGTRKPDSAIFLTACRRLGIDPVRSWFVGDNPDVDIVGAGQIGCRTIWLKRSIPWPAEHEPCYTLAVSSLEHAFREILRDA